MKRRWHCQNRILQILFPQGWQVQASQQLPCMLQITSSSSSGPLSSLPHCTEALLPSLKHVLLNCWHTSWQGLFLRLVWARWEYRRGTGQLLVHTGLNTRAASSSSSHHHHHHHYLHYPSPVTIILTTVSHYHHHHHHHNWLHPHHLHHPWPPPSAAQAPPPMFSDHGELKDAEGTCQNTVTHWGQLDHPFQENKICKLGQFTPSWLYRSIFFRVHLTWQSRFCCHKVNTCTQLLVSSQ